MFLLRMAFWLGLVVLLLPSDEQQQARLYQAAVSTVERATTFCDRNARVCAASGELWATFLKKAEFAVRLAIDAVGSSGRREEMTAPAAQPAAARTRPDPRLPASARGTLTPSDLAPAWRGQAQRTGA